MARRERVKDLVAEAALIRHRFLPSDGDQSKYTNSNVKVNFGDSRKSLARGNLGIAGRGIAGQLRLCGVHSYKVVIMSEVEIAMYVPRSEKPHYIVSGHFTWATSVLLEVLANLDPVAKLDEVGTLAFAVIDVAVMDKYADLFHTVTIWNPVTCEENVFAQLQSRRLAEIFQGMYIDSFVLQQLFVLDKIPHFYYCNATDRFVAFHDLMTFPTDSFVCKDWEQFAQTLYSACMHRYRLTLLAFESIPEETADELAESIKAASCADGETRSENRDSSRNGNVELPSPPASDSTSCSILQYVFESLGNWCTSLGMGCCLGLDRRS